MYLDTLVKIPNEIGKITYREKKDAIYVEYLIENTYDPSVKYSRPKRKGIGKVSLADQTMMQPNENYLRYVPGATLPEEKEHSVRSSCLRIGNYVVIQKLIRDLGLREILQGFFSEKDVGLFLDLMIYSIVSENNASQYYPDYAYNHPLFTEKMHIYSDSKVSDFFHSITDDHIVGFLNAWNEKRDHREKIYISYDSTNKNSQAGDIEFVEYGKPKTDLGLPIINYSIAYDTENREPLFYEEYPGSINDVSQLEFMVDKAYGYGYRKIGFILDRGYFSKANIEKMDECGYSFIIMMKGMSGLASELISEKKGTFENKRICNIPEYRVYGTTIKKKLYATDAKDRYFHIYHSVGKEAAEREKIESRIEQMKRVLDKHKGKIKEFGPGFQSYFELYYDEKSGAFVHHAEKTTVIEDEMNLCGYFIIVTSEKMTAKEAIDLYKSRDASEKLFRADKTFLDNKSLRVYSDISMSAKIFLEFVALIIRSRIYTEIKDEAKSYDSVPNYMNVPSAIKELEKIEMSRQLDGKYRLDHAVTATQKAILKAFDLDENNIKYRAEEIGRQLISA